MVKRTANRQWLRFRTALILLCLVAASSAVAEVLEETARITSLIGKVEVRPGESVAWRPARLGMPVRMKWDVRSYLESTADITFESGTVLRVGENSVVTLSKMLKNTAVNANRSSVKVATGQVWANVKKLTSSQSEFHFETPTAVAAIRGTRLGLLVAAERTQIDVFEGLVEVRQKGGNRSVPLTSESRAVIVPEEDIRVIPFQSLSDSGHHEDSRPVDPFASQSVSPPSDTSRAVRGAAPAPVLRISSPVPGTVVSQTPLTVQGKADPGATVVVFDKVLEVGSDGSFAVMVDLKAGPNTIPVLVDVNGRTASQEILVEYRPVLELNVGNLSDNMTVGVTSLDLDIEVTPGAAFSVNGVENNIRVALTEGANRIRVEAWDAWQNRTSREYVVQCRQSADFELLLATPLEGQTIYQTSIGVSGSTAPGAIVEVNRTRVQVGSDGYFSTKIPIPDEPQSYTIEVRAQLGDRELTKSREISYQRRTGPMFLDMVSPLQGQVVSRRVLQVTGRTDPAATVMVNGRRAAIAPSGVFSADITISEREIGDFPVEVIAQRGTDELSRTVTVEADGSSPQINTSAPVCALQTAVANATRSGTIRVQVADRTPEDQVTLSVANNGSVDRTTMESGGSGDIVLAEGRNVYRISALDRAGNPSNVISGQIYYLPGPLSIVLTDPDRSPFPIEGLPPLPRGGSYVPRRTIEVEIDDGIGSVPETIRFVRISGAGQTTVLRETRAYRYRGQVELQRGANSFVLQAEDIAGNSNTARLTIVLE